LYPQAIIYYCRAGACCLIKQRAVWRFNQA
jgi:hypothetical protein